MTGLQAYGVSTTCFPQCPLPSSNLPHSLFCLLQTSLPLWDELCKNVCFSFLSLCTVSSTVANSFILDTCPPFSILLLLVGCPSFPNLHSTPKWHFSYWRPVLFILLMRSIEINLIIIYCLCFSKITHWCLNLIYFASFLSLSFISFFWLLL